MMMTNYYDKINCVLKILISQLASVNIPQQTRPALFITTHTAAAEHSNNNNNPGPIADF